MRVCSDRRTRKRDYCQVRGVRRHEGTVDAPDGAASPSSKQTCDSGGIAFFVLLRFSNDLGARLHAQGDVLTQPGYRAAEVTARGSSCVIRLPKGNSRGIITVGQMSSPSIFGQAAAAVFTAIAISAYVRITSATECASAARALLRLTAFTGVSPLVCRRSTLNV